MHISRITLSRRALAIMLAITLSAGLSIGASRAYAATDAGDSFAAAKVSTQASKTAGFTVSFKANGGKGSMPAQTVQRGKETALSANKFTRSGYKFAGWNTKADGTGKSYANKAKVKNLAKAGKSVTLYAQWRKSAIRELKVGKTYKKYDITGDGKADKVTIKGVSAANPAGDGVYRYLNVYVNGKKRLSTTDSESNMGVYPTVKLVNLDTGQPLLYVRYLTHSGYYTNGWLYKCSAKKISLMADTTDIARRYSSSHAGAYRTYEMLDSASGNVLTFTAGSFSTSSTQYSYRVKSGKLIEA